MELSYQYANVYGFSFELYNNFGFGIHWNWIECMPEQLLCIRSKQLFYYYYYLAYSVRRTTEDNKTLSNRMSSIWIQVFSICESVSMAKSFLYRFLCLFFVFFFFSLSVHCLCRSIAISGCCTHWYHQCIEEEVKKNDNMEIGKKRLNMLVFKCHR